MPLDYKDYLAATVTPSVKIYEYSLGKTFFNFRNQENMGNAFQGTVNFLFYLAFTISIVFIAVSGVKFMSSAGDKSKLETATSSLKYSVLALVLVFLLGQLINYTISIFSGGPSYILPFSSLFLTNP